MIRTKRSIFRMLDKQQRRKDGLVIAFMTDLVRTPDPVRAMLALAPGTLVIFRHYDDPDREILGRRLRAIAKRRRLPFLVAGDRRLAKRLKADGLHLPDGMVRRRARFAPLTDRWLVTAAAHGRAGARRADRADIDMVLLSPIFATASHPGRPPMGLIGLASSVRQLGCRVLALGGIGPNNARRVLKIGGVGLAGISGIAQLSHDPYTLRDPSNWRN